MSLVGIALGILVGAVSGTVAVTFTRTLAQQSAKSAKTVIALTAEFLALPTSWFGGSWMTSSWLAEIDRAAIIQPYALSLAVTFMVVFGYPLVRYVIHQGNTIGRVDRQS
ncbi:MAG: hypothetical protein GTN78_03610 [Gemmatimonadales bacterium]|nr:hypothetical protein [Gemmatimonadales bacterium]NIQ99272.1 hypothetical protein [Gemmatimonadales bacterium]